jgi:uncharacterized LabA/DUF88 family protein
MDMSPFLTISEVSAVTGENQETLKKRCQSGLIVGATKKGKTWLIPQIYVVGISKLTAGVYIDGANIIHGALDAGWRIDYLKLKDFIKRKYDPTIFSYYDSLGYEKNNGILLRDEKGAYIPKASSVQFFNFLRGSGYRVTTKPLKYIDNDPSKPKNNMDSYLTIDILKEQSQWDVLILFSGDSDFDKLVDDLMVSGKNVHIFSFNNRLSYELRTKALNSPLVTYTEIDKLKEILKQEPKRQGL